MHLINSYANTKNILEVISLRLKVIDKSELILNKEKKELQNYQNELKEYIDIIEKNLKTLKGIEYELFYEIVVNGLNATKAVDKVAYYNDKDASTIWKNYYPNIKKELELLKTQAKVD